MERRLQKTWHASSTVLEIFADLRRLDICAVSRGATVEACVDTRGWTFAVSCATRGGQIIRLVGMYLGADF